MITSNPVINPAAKFLLSGAAWLAIGAVVRSCTSFLFSKRYRVHKAGAILISGTSSGIGRHAALSLDSAGYTVYAGVRKEADAKSLTNERSSLKPIILDVSDSESVNNAAENVKNDLKRTGGKLVAIINNAGVSKGMPIELEDIKDVIWAFQVNVFGVIRMCKAFIPMLRASNGRIVNISSVNGQIATKRGGTYAATKFGVEAISDALRLELDQWGISVSIIQPAYIKTLIAAKQLGKNLPWRNLTEDHYALYKDLFDSYSSKREKVERLAASPTVSSAAIIHAITSSYPKTRYAVANVGVIPAWFVLLLKWILPDRVFDVFNG
mmetsp:Transcript_16988/g.27621  ORF Transcript_16988/g.27621 Transcript_16988/m.27621 type:complete len:324 (-) Transcript_16988:232-1203(-)